MSAESQDPTIGPLRRAAQEPCEPDLTRPAAGPYSPPMIFPTSTWAWAWRRERGGGVA
jgi:hypothetical protein